MPVRVASTTANGVLDVPADIREAGWWSGGARLGDPFGSTLIAAHVDSASQGLGPFASLLQVRSGDRVRLHSDHLRQVFVVRSLRLLPRPSFAGRPELRSPHGPRRLVLVTCAPPYDPARGGYQNLAVVVGTPVSDPDLPAGPMTRTAGNRDAMSLGLVIVLAVVIMAVVLALVLIRPGAGDPGDDESHDAPRQDPPSGQDIRASISAEGVLEVTHTVSTRTPVSSLLLRPAPSAGPVGSTTVTKVTVTTSGATVATFGEFGSTTQHVPLGRVVSQFTVTYRIAPSLGGDPATVRGRGLVFAPALRIDYRNEIGPIHRRVTAPGQILNVACVRPDGSEPRPCGSATSDGWQVDLDGEDRDDGLLVQTQLSD